jgi:hypothetical protein
MKGYHDFKQTMVEPNTWEAFQELEFECDTKREPDQLAYNEAKRILSRPAVH